MTMLCVQTLRVVLSVCAILASMEMACPVQVSHYTMFYSFSGCVGEYYNYIKSVLL